MARFGAMQMEETLRGEGLPQLVHNSVCTTSLGTNEQTGLESKKEIGKIALHANE